MSLIEEETTSNSFLSNLISSLDNDVACYNNIENEEILLSNNFEYIL